MKHSKQIENKSRKDKEIDWVEIMVECGCGRRHKWKIHNVKESAWIEKTE